jgi:2,3-bisphosphoglycerate-independent phosphoglycerate mutase
VKKIFYVVLDGLGDVPIKALRNKTPLEASVTPYLDSLAQRGKTGLVYPVAKGIIPESDVAAFSLLGYDTQKYSITRVALECKTFGLEVFEGDLALRASFACLEPGSRTIKERFSDTGVSVDEAAALARDINSKVTLSSATFEFKNTEAGRGLLLIRGMHFRLSARITDIDSFRFLSESAPQPGYKQDPDAKEAAALLNEFTAKAHKVLTDSMVNKKRVLQNKLPVNAVLSSDAGSHMQVVPKMASAYNLKLGYFVKTPVERTIASMLGLEEVACPPLSGHADVDYPVLAKVAAEYLLRYNGLYVHIKDTDMPGHNGDYMKKIKVIEELDAFLFAKLATELDSNDTLIAVTSGHATPCNKKIHSADPVPLVISGGTIRSDGSLSFSEKSAKFGSLGELRGQEILPLLVKCAGK